MTHILAGIAILWLFQPLYSQLEIPLEWVSELAAIGLGVSLILSGVVIFWRQEKSRIGRILHL